MAEIPTIFAPATAHGRAGIAVVRISGPKVRAALMALGCPLPSARMATLATFAQKGVAIDRGLVLWFPAPHSFTGEDMAELHVHGSRAVLQALARALGGMDGLCMAEPGEFARRAFLNGKLDLAEVEGIADLVDAETEVQRMQALRVLQGEASARYEALRKQAVHALAHLEAAIDFSDEDIPPTLFATVNAEVQSLAKHVAELLGDRRGQRIREGISIVILGAPNAGKSSLLNALARREAAIVSHTAGTTRDLIEVHLDIAGFACVLVDTAGLRDSTDPVEQEGIRRARARAASADIKLLLFDGARLPALDTQTQALADANALVIISKADALSAPSPVSVAGLTPLPVSVQRGEGLDALLATLEARLRASLDMAGAAPLITRERHREALTQALGHLQRFLQGLPIELACEELRLAAQQLGKITGKISVDELLDAIFREFCIGK